jgi:hypothetical protein
MSRLQMAIDQIVFARKYSLELLDQLPVDDWFRKTSGGVSHIGWQVGHLAVAEHRLALWRIRGSVPSDDQLRPKEYIALFGFESVPVFEPDKYPSPAEIRGVFDRVHEQVLRELKGLDDAELDQPVLNPHPFARTKLQALTWCAHHEMLHAGQIGLLRRELGYAPL